MPACPTEIKGLQHEIIMLIYGWAIFVAKPQQKGRWGAQRQVLRYEVIYALSTQPGA
jgi:hypothetical protein